ncbi:MAG: murein biosynthesis integral membrane protein MurJ [Actinomycetota bacterium]|nr:murein biosynthesis integral membrane protein MurJ [Actinomycetota bacterium]
MSAEARPAGGSVDIATQSLARPAAVMAVGTVLSRLTGLGRVAAMAFALGVAESRLADSYNVANTLPNVVYELVLGGVLTSVFIPVLVGELRTRPHDDAWSSASAMVTASLAVLAGLTVLTVVLAPWLVDLFTLSASGRAVAEQRDLATFFLRLFAPQVALYGFAAIASGLLNAHGRFAVPMFAPILNNLLVIGTFLAFAAVTSGTPTDASVNHDLGLKLLLGAGTTGGVAAMAIAYWPFLRALPGRLRVRFDLRHPAVRRLARLSAWTVGYVITNTIGFGVSFALANGVQGGVTAYVTAFAFFQLPIGVAAISIVTALAPRMAAHHVDGDLRQFAADFARGTRSIALLLLPATAGLIVLAHPMIRTLLEHGVVRSSSADLVASVLQMFAIGLLPFSLYQLLMRAFYSRQDARTPALINVVENAVTIGLDFALWPVMHVEGLALAHTLGYVVGTAVAAVMLARRVGGLERGRTLDQLVRVTVASAVCAGAMLGTVAVVSDALSPGGVRSLVELVAGAAVGLVVFLVAARALDVEDLSLFRRLLPGR